MNTKIKTLKALQILNSRGVPTLKTFVFLEDGTVGYASVPQGASTGKKEAKELRDRSKAFFGKSVNKNIALVEGEIASALKGKDVLEQDKIDRLLIKLDGTKTKEKLRKLIFLTLHSFLHIILHLSPSFIS